MTPLTVSQNSSYQKFWMRFLPPLQTAGSWVTIDHEGNQFRGK